MYLKIVFQNNTWCFHGGEDSSRILLGCDIVECCCRIPTFRRPMLPPSSGWSKSRWKNRA